MTTEQAIGDLNRWEWLALLGIASADDPKLAALAATSWGGNALKVLQVNATENGWQFTAITGFTDEGAQDAVGNILTDSSTIDFIYTDATPSITADVKADSIGNSLLANMVQATLKGRAAAAGTGDPTDLTPAQAKTLLAIVAGDVSGLALIATSGSATDLSAGAVPAARMPALTGDVTTSAGAVATTIGANKVTDGMLRQSAGLSVIARAASTTGNVADVTAALDHQVLRRSGAGLGFGAVNLASTNAVTGTLPVGSGGTGVAALGDITKADDTNITLTLGGTPTGSVISSVSFTLGWTGVLSVARGGLGVGTITGLMQGNGTGAVTGIGNSSAVGQILRVTGASTYAWGALDLADADAVTGDLPFANLTQGSALSVLGVTGNATADVASIAAGTDHQVLRRSGTTLTFGAVNLAQSAAVTGTLAVGNGGTGTTTSTGTGNVVLSASPTLTGTLNAAAASFSGNVTLGDATSDSHICNGQFSLAVPNNASVGVSVTDVGGKSVILTASDGGTGVPAVGTFTNHDFGLFRNAAVVGTLTTLGLNLASTKTLSVNGTQVLTSRRTGWGAPTGTATRTTFATTTVTLPQLAERVKALIDDLMTHGALGA